MTYFYTKGEETLTEDELVQRYRDDLDTIYRRIRLEGFDFAPSEVFEKLAPNEFRGYFLCWTLEEGWEEHWDEQRKTGSGVIDND